MLRVLDRYFKLIVNLEDLTVAKVIVRFYLIQCQLHFRNIV